MITVRLLGLGLVREGRELLATRYITILLSASPSIALILLELSVVYRGRRIIKATRILLIY